ncbi:GLPGLI family protein [Chryseobacterium sp.]|uniref:GLPGLI family protein n=1 Tax=Chryseobacterium sp. TaxID=1871047 RepID=UPI00289E1F09|nr:GLPGLI family protein [Chryseobacterium sp.]
MRIYTLYLLFVISITNAQNTRFIYEYSFIPNLKKQSIIKSEIMYLDTSSSGSLYYSLNSFINDSTMIADAKLGKITMPIEDKINERIIKTYPNYKIYFFTKLYIEKYKVLDERIQKWKILNEKSMIENFQVQKATLDFGGRKWIAWFTTEIPIQDGPYKFHGLPGLILKMEDITKSHLFQLRGIKSLADNFMYPEIDKSKKYIEINQKKYEKLFKDYRADPIKDLRQLFNEGKILQYTDTSGNIITPSQTMRRAESERKTLILQDNNIIEIDLLK